MDAEVLLLQVHGNRRVSLFAHSHHWSFKLPLFTWRFTTFLAITFRSCCCCQSNALPWSPCWKCWHTRTLMNICLCRHSIARPQFRLCFATSQVIELNWTGICTSAVSLTLLVDLLDADVRTLFVSTDCGTDFLGLLVPGWPVVPFSLFIVDGTLLMTWWLSTVSSSSAFSAGQLTSVSSFTSLSSSISGSSSLSTSRELYFRLL